MAGSPNEHASPSGPPTALAAFFGHSGVRYLIAGGLSFLVDLGLLALLHDVANWPLWLATGTAFLVSFAFTYTIQRLYSFGSSVPHGRALVKYAALVAVNTLATIAIVALCSPLAIGWVGGKVLAAALTTVWNYFVYRYWIFPRPADTAVTSEPAGKD